ncbi:hypothetical protein KP509_02G114400 [Ceratopteris richardii]|uniref:HHO5-like N-terminal domain-containing protein n=1 Tax=Ceratopteris richardii TaxID=49495 RepID=A0A8T2VGR3_CERRI|nr:hypothetical protein KP509_02G114400 [Ceratopteris richardii]
MPMPSLLAEDLCLGYKHTRAATDQKENKAYELRTNVKGEVFSDSSVVATSVPLNAPSGLRELEAYHKALQEERVKIKAFGRELPFCLQLLLDDDDGHAYSLEDEIVEINVYNDKKKTDLNLCQQRGWLEYLVIIVGYFTKDCKEVGEACTIKRRRWLPEVSTCLKGSIGILKALITLSKKEGDGILCC